MGTQSGRHSSLARAAALSAGLIACSLVIHGQAAPRVQKGGLTVSLLTREGERLEGHVRPAQLSLRVDGKERALKLRDVLSVHLADAPSSHETEAIRSGLAAVAGTDRKARDGGVERLTEIGLPVLSPLLAAYKDIDAREPKPLYRLFSRIIPASADGFDRNLDLVRLTDGTALRGDIRGAALELTGTEGKSVKVGLEQVRRIAVRQPLIERAFDIHTLYHCSQIEYLDAGVGITPASKLTADAHGFARLAFDGDGWACDPDGLKKPGPNYKSNLFDGFPFGALVARVGADGPRWFAGKHAEKTHLGSGRLYFAVNDNPHWQNNLGSYRIKLRVTDAYDLGDPQ